VNDRLNRLLARLEQFERGAPDGPAVVRAMRALREGRPVNNPQLAELAARLVADVDAIKALEAERVFPTTD
jgi:hypothetical protein